MDFLKYRGMFDISFERRIFTNLNQCSIYLNIHKFKYPVTQLLVTMGVVKIDRNEEIDTLLAKIYLDTKLKLTKKELLELIFDHSTEDYDQLLLLIKDHIEKDNEILRKKFINQFSGIIDEEIDEEIDPKSIWLTSGDIE